jgi:hypothetical protein
MPVSRIKRSLGQLAAVAGLTAALVAGAATTAASAAADGNGKALDSRLVGLPASMTGQTLFGVVAGGLPWRLDSGHARLFGDGRLHVDVEGLVLAAGPKEGTNPIPNARAIVTCAGAVAASSVVVPYSAEGDAEIDDTLSLPSPCLAPAVFFAGVPAPNVAAWFAVTGL